MQNSLNNTSKKKSGILPILIGVVIGLLIAAGVFATVIFVNNAEPISSDRDETTEKFSEDEIEDAGIYSGDNKEYFIGATGPLTGDAASYGISVMHGAMVAIEEINANGGLNGKMFKFDIRDDQAAADKATAAYNQLYEAGMQVAIGSVTSGSCEAFAAGAKADNVFFMTPSASADVCIAAPNAFRVCFGDPDQGKLAAEELAANYENIGVIYDSSDVYSSSIFEAFKAEIDKLGKSFIEQSFTAENKRDFSTQIYALKDCDVIFLPIYYTEASLIAKEAVAQGNDAVIFGCDGFDGIQELVAGVPNTIMYITPFDVNSDNEKVKKFVQTYEQKYGEAPDQFAADSYDAVMAIYKAMKAANVDNVKIAPEKLSEILQKSILEITYEGVTGTMTWSSNGAAIKEPIIKELN